MASGNNMVKLAFSLELRNQSVLSNTSLDNGNMRSPLHTSSPNHQENQRPKFPHNFGMPHWQQVQDAFDGSRAL
jgi:hypothetical protein